MDPIQQTFGAQGGGLALLKKEVTVTNRGGAALLGEVRVFDFTQTDAAVTNNIPGDAASGTRNARVLLVTDEHHGVPCVYLAAAADDADVKCAVAGPCQALVTTAGAFAVGSPLYINVDNPDSFSTLKPATGAKVVGFLNEAVAGAIDAVLTDVIIGHFGAAV